LLFEEFAGMLREKDGPSRSEDVRLLDRLTRRAVGSGIPELKAFAVKLRQDTEAVVAATVIP